MFALPRSLQSVIERWKPFFILYGLPLTMFLLVCVLAGLSYGLTLLYVDIDNFENQVNLADATSVWGASVSGTPGAVLVADIFYVDVVSQTLSVHWSLAGGCGQTYTHAANDSCLQNQFMEDLALYINENATSSWATTTPIGIFKVSAIQNPPPVNYLAGRSMIPPQQFDTIIPMDPFLPYTNDKTESTLYYPFDQFNSYVSLLAINPGNNSAIPISGVIGYGAVVGWKGISTFHPITIGEETMYSIIIQVGRLAMVRAFVIALVVTNWLLSLTVMWMTWLVVFNANIDNAIILVSTAILFAIPQIRASMPDAPPFGAFIDIGGYFLNICLVSVCTSILLFSQLRYRNLPSASSDASNHEESQAVN